MVPFGTSGSEWPLANQPGMPPVMHDAEWRLFKTIVIPAKMASSFHRVKIPCNREHFLAFSQRAFEL